MYRSFVTCDDPKGVVECGTIRKSKIGPQRTKHKIISHDVAKNSSAALVHKAEKKEVLSKGIIKEYHTPSSFQLLEISREAQKLNQMIDSWSKGLSYDGQSKDIAQDLLKGALDLQESLLMLGKWQEASQYMTRKTKQKEKLERGRINEVGAKLMNSDRFGDQNCKNSFQKLPFSATGSSRDCLDELKKAITDSLARQNLLLIRNTGEKNYHDRQKMDSDSDVPSTSSSKSSAAQSDSSHSIESISATTLPRKVNGPNLIAKLMGLENLPSNSMQEQLNIEKELSRRRPVFYTERIPPTLVQKVGSDERTLKDVLEAKHFKGLLRSHSVKELKSSYYPSTEIHTNQRSVDDIPPIVLIRPCVPCLERKESPAPIFQDVGALRTKSVPRNMKLRGVAPRSADYTEGTLNTSKIHDKTQRYGSTIKMLCQEGVDDGELVVEPEETEAKTVVQEGVALNANKKHRKLEAEESLMKRLGKEVVMNQKKLVARAAEDEKFKTKLESSLKLKRPSPGTHQQQKTDGSNQKVSKTKTVEATSRKPVEMEISKHKHVTPSQDQAKVINSKIRAANGSISTKAQFRQPSSTSPVSISIQKRKNTIHDSKKQNKVVNPVANCKSAKPNTENLGCQEEDDRISLTCGNDSILKGTTATVAAQISPEEETWVSKLQIEEHCSESQSSICIGTLLTSKNEKDAKSSEEADDDIGVIRKENTCVKSGNQLKAVLLRSPLFLSHAEDLFHLDMDFPKMLSNETSGIYGSGKTDMEVSLDYANEYIERSSCIDFQARHPPIQINAGVDVSLDQLMEEVVSGVENLKSYCKLASENDGLNGILESDIRCGGVVSGTWGLGWRNGFSMDESEQIVSDIEKLVVSELIEEMLT